MGEQIIWLGLGLGFRQTELEQNHQCGLQEEDQQTVLPQEALIHQHLQQDVEDLLASAVYFAVAC